MTLQTHFFRGDKATALYSACINHLSGLRYDTDWKNWNFEKYLMGHVKEHNTLETFHGEYGQQRMPEAMKIKYFQDGISDRTFVSVWLSIQANPTLFPDFDTIKDQYLTFKRTQQCMEQIRSPTHTPSLRWGAAAPVADAVGMYVGMEQKKDVDKNQIVTSAA